MTMKNIYTTDSHSIDINDDGLIEEESTRIKRNKLTQLKKLRKKIEQGGILYGDYIIKTDDKSLTKIVSTVMALQYGLVNSVNWKSSNGWINNADLEIMSTIAVIVTNHVNLAFNVEKVVSDIIENSTDEEITVLDVNALWDEQFAQLTG